MRKSLRTILLKQDSLAAKNFLARTSGLDNRHVNLCKALLNGLTTDGLFNSDGTTNFFDALYIFATQDHTTAALSLVSATFNATENGPSFTADRGFTGNGTTQNLTSNFNPIAAVSPKFTQNSAHLSVWNLTNQVDAAAAIGYNGNINAIYPKFTGNDIYLRINDISAGIAISDPRGHLLGNRSSSTDRQGYQNASTTLSGGGNGSTAAYGSVSSVAPATAEILILSESGTYSTDQIAMASIGASLSSGNVTLFYNRLRTYMTAVGVP